MVPFKCYQLAMILRPTEAESIEKHGIWDPMSSYGHSRPRVVYNTLPWATLCQSRPFPMPESILSPSKGLWIWPRMDFWFPTMTLPQSHRMSSPAFRIV
jgi:hypothetical protein